MGLGEPQGKFGLLGEGRLLLLFNQVNKPLKLPNYTDKR